MHILVLGRSAFSDDFLGCKSMGFQPYEKMTPTTTMVFFLMAAAAILFLMDLSQKLIRSSEISGEQPSQIRMQSN